MWSISICLRISRIKNAKVNMYTLPKWIQVFHPRFPSNFRGPISLSKTLPFDVRSVREVAISWLEECIWKNCHGISCFFFSVFDLNHLPTLKALITWIFKTPSQIISSQEKERPLKNKEHLPIQGTRPYHLGKRSIIFKSFLWDIQCVSSEGTCYHPPAEKNRWVF